MDIICVCKIGLYILNQSVLFSLSLLQKIFPRVFRSISLQPNFTLRCATFCINITPYNFRLFRRDQLYHFVCVCVCVCLCGMYVAPCWHALRSAALFSPPIVDAVFAHPRWQIENDQILFGIESATTPHVSNSCRRRSCRNDRTDCEHFEQRQQCVRLFLNVDIVANFGGADTSDDDDDAATGSDAHPSVSATTAAAGVRHVRHDAAEKPLVRQPQFVVHLARSESQQFQRLLVVGVVTEFGLFAGPAARPPTAYVATQFSPTSCTASTTATPTVNRQLLSRFATTAAAIVAISHGSRLRSRLAFHVGHRSDGAALHIEYAAQNIAVPSAEAEDRLEL